MNTKYRQKRFWCKTLPIFLAMMILAGCSSGGAGVTSSDAEGEAISQKNDATMEIPTKTPKPTHTPLSPTNTPEPTDTPLLPTSTPAPTATQSPIPTPLPSPDAKAMIAWKELGLSSEYVAFSPEAIGIEEGANAFAFTIGEEYKEYNISGSFLFANGENPSTQIFGYTILLPTDDDLQIFDQIIYGYVNFGGHEFTALENAYGIGNYSNGKTGEVDGERLTAIVFRINNIGALVFVKHEPTVEPGIDPIQVARVYARSIDEAVQYCKITSAKAVPNSDVPTFEVEAEGFYPREGRYIRLEGATVIDGEPLTFGTGKLGETGETVDPDGSLSDVISMPVMEPLDAEGDQNAGPAEGPIEFILTVGGYFSHCEATQTVIWP